MKKDEQIHWLSPLVLLLVSIWITKHGSELGSYIIFFLIILANGQIRLHILKGRSILISIFIELMAVYYLHEQYHGLTYLLVYIPLIDGLRLLGEEKIFATIISTGLLYWLIRMRELEIVLINVLLLIIVILLILSIDKMRRKIKELEKHYDENRKYSYQLEESKVRLELYNRNIENLAQMEERNRISREIHDTIGHKLTATLLQLEAVIRVSELKGDTKKMLESVRDNLSNSVDILRKTVKKVSGSQDITGINSIKKLVQDFQMSTSVEVSVEIKGMIRKLYPSIELAIYKNIQEAMTNAIRHGMCTEVYIHINYYAHEVEFSVGNNGKSCEEIKMGMGLKGMKERTELIGGRLIIESQKDGFQVKGTIPVEGEV